MAETATAAIHSPPTSPTRPKGILKNAGPGGVAGVRLTWDEENLALTEIGKDSLMKITEPKTPYVRYNAELDTVEGMSEIPPFHLDNDGAGSPMSVPSSPLPTSQATVAPGASFSPATSVPIRPGAQRGNSIDRSSRRTSFSDRPLPSGSSSRSTSFNVSADDPERTKLQAGGLGLIRGDEVEEDEEMDEETAAKHAEFICARGRHYSNEAEAMKRAQKLMEEEDDDETSGDNDVEMEDQSLPNGRPR